jgi:enoyl-CoA hydratase
MADIEVEHPRDGVTLVRLNRPDRLNALTTPMMRLFVDVLREVDRDPGCRVVVLTGAGRGFCAGADLANFTEDAEDDHAVTWDTQKAFSEVTLAMRAIRAPIIAAVNGPATGGGLVFALASDIRFAAESARFGAAFVRIGLSASDMGCGWLLNRVVGAGRAHELLLTGRIIDAAEAERIGLVSEVVAGEQLLDRVLAECELIVRNTPLGVELTKEAMWSSLEIPGLRAAIDLDNRSQVLMSAMRDSREAAWAFVQKRDPNYHRN